MGKPTKETLKQRKVSGIATYDAQNKLNDLSNVEWLTFTKSVWQSRPPPRDALKEQHPATFAESDIEKLILFFTKKGGRVLDPFSGSGSTLIACLHTGRGGLGVELVDKWISISNQRLERAKVRSLTNPTESVSQSVRTQPVLELMQGDSRTVLNQIAAESFDFVVTSPPYWAILTKARDHKSKRERLSKGLPTKYSEDKRDLGNAPSYREFLHDLTKVFSECYRVLKQRKYMVIVVSDFRHGSKFVPFHNDLSQAVEKVGFSLEGITILVQDSKNLYPYGMPYAFVSNIHHQYILIFRKGMKRSGFNGV
ncbi:MAG TPA: DNA methyltransferase [Candidatus Acidoferrales bacterium]|nr:DNA methyltransferase [Candidatus Acidoferrales bacterium]